MSKYTSLREEAWLANIEIPKRNLALYTWGNASAFDPDLAVFAIKPSGVEYEQLRPEDMVIVDLQGKVVEGKLKPSSDTATHAILLREYSGLGVRGVVHTHSTFAVSWAQACRSIPIMGTTHADHTTHEIPCTPYLDAQAVKNGYEEETGKLIVKTLAAQKLNASELTMVLVAGHGPFTWGNSAAKAVYHSAVLEELAHMALLSEQLAKSTPRLPDHIVQKHFERKHGAKAYYGQ